jgi:CubicO group peptidase (beta-lactamase class C family)
VLRALDWNMSNVAAAGDLYSTVGDLFRWNEALFGGKVLSAASVQAAFTVGFLDGDDSSHPEDTGYGFGWTIDRLRGLREISHGGELAGFGSYLLRLPAEKLTVVVLLNCVPQLPGLQQWQLARRIAELALGPALPPQRERVVDTNVSFAALDAVVGKYDMGDRLTLTVTREGQKVFMEITGRPKIEIHPQSERIFFVNAGEAEATFVRDANGKVTKAILKQAGARIDARREN